VLQRNHCIARETDQQLAAPNQSYHHPTVALLLPLLI
jgi:hypothetical protein